MTVYSEENYLALFPLSRDYSRLEGTFLCVTNPFAVPPKAARDLHALSTPPAFILSQDQTLNKNERSEILIEPALLFEEKYGGQNSHAHFEHPEFFDRNSGELESKQFLIE